MRRIFVFALVLLFGCASLSDTTFLGQQYLGAKYISDPLGEERAPDTDALIRTDAFDCTTFVETVLANGNLKKLTKIRYKDGKVDILYRNHFIESDWLENNSDIVENVSQEYAPVSIRRVVIDKSAWFKTQHNIDANFALRTIDLEYIPYSAVENIRVSEPIIVLFIVGKSEKRARILGTDIAVVHMGFLLPDGKLRHASSVAGCVLDTDFSQYIAQRAQNTDNLGIVLVKIK